MYRYDSRTVLTLDAGGTNFVFSAMQGNEEVVQAVVYPAPSDNLELCLHTISKGFREIQEKLKQPAVAISFAFPGPADYEHGIIGDLPNFMAFRGGIALGPFLEKQFNIPVFINNDGNLFAYGEAIAGTLPLVNNQLILAESRKRYNNLLGITLGTGFGGGVVINNRLLTGDNGCGGDVWCFRNKKYQDMIVEESVSIRAIKRVYSELSGVKNETLTPKDIFDVAEGSLNGNQEAAIQSFQELGEMAGDAIAYAVTIVDGIVVIGGGLAGAGKYILPSLVQEMNNQLSTFSKVSFSRLTMKAYNLESPEELKLFLQDKSTEVTIPFSDEKAVYDNHRKIGVILSKTGTNKAVSLGAYSFALASLDKNN